MTPSSLLRSSLAPGVLLYRCLRELLAAKINRRGSAPQNTARATPGKLKIEKRAPRWARWSTSCLSESCGGFGCLVCVRVGSTIRQATSRCEPPNFVVAAERKGYFGGCSSLDGRGSPWDAKNKTPREGAVRSLRRHYNIPSGCSQHRSEKGRLEKVRGWAYRIGPAPNTVVGNLRGGEYFHDVVSSGGADGPVSRL